MKTEQDVKLLLEEIKETIADDTDFPLDSYDQGWLDALEWMLGDKSYFEALADSKYKEANYLGDDDETAFGYKNSNLQQRIAQSIYPPKSHLERLNQITKKEAVGKEIVEGEGKPETQEKIHHVYDPNFTYICPKCDHKGEVWANDYPINSWKCIMCKCPVPKENIKDLRNISITKME